MPCPSKYLFPGFKIPNNCSPKQNEKKGADSEWIKRPCLIIAWPRSHHRTLKHKPSIYRQLHGPLNYLTSSSTIIPLLVLLILIIYYLVSLTGALREANQDLRTQLQKEREEERRKIFQIKETTAASTTTSAARATHLWRRALEASTSPEPIVQATRIDIGHKETLLTSENGKC